MPTDSQRQLHTRLLTALADADTHTLTDVLTETHVADLAEILADFEPHEQQAVVEALSDEQAAELLDELEAGDRNAVLDMLSLERTADILEKMPSDEVTDLLAYLPTAEANALMERMEPAQVEEVTDLLRYAEDSAGGLMAKEFIGLHPDQTVREVLDLLRHQEEAEMVYYLYVLDDEERLIGTVTLRTLIVSPPETAISDLMTREFVSVPTAMPQEDVAEVVRRHDLLAVPVLDDDGRMQGIVTVDDIGDVVQEEAAGDLLEISGTEETEEAPQPRVAWRGRRSGLLALGGGLVAATLIWFSAGALTDWVEVAALLPLLLLLGITAGSQAALAIDHAYESATERLQPGRAFLRELWAGAALASLSTLLAGAFIFVTRHSTLFAIAVAVPLGVGLWITSVAGALGALALRRMEGRSGPAAHTIIVIIALLVGISVYLWTALLLAVPRQSP